MLQSTEQKPLPSTLIKKRRLFKNQNMKSVIYVCMIIGSALGSYIPLLWGAGYFSFSSVILTAIGGFFGIWVGYRISS